MKKTIFALYALLLGSALVYAEAPSFTLRNLQGDLVNSDDYFGKGPVLVDFWATWCKPCLKNLPKLEKIQQEYVDKGLTILAINEDGTRSLSKVEPLVNSLGLTFPVLIDQDRDVMRLYNVSGLPTSVLVDQNKDIVMTLRGYRPGDEAELKKTIESLLKDEEK